jgi:hypothetical protein
MRFSSWCLPFVLLGCGSSSVSVAPDDAAITDASDALDAVADDATSDVTTDAITDASDGAAPTLRACATTGKGGIAGDVCYLLTPAESGLPAAGVNATVDQYALRPTSGARGKLVLFFNGSGGSPAAGTRPSPTTNFYTTARAAGLHLFAVSYRSDDAIGVLCKGDDACFLPTRRTVLTGVYEAGAPASLKGITADEGAFARLLAGLQTLAAGDPSGGWDAFLDPTATKPVDRIRWSKLIPAGHSQGGGHAALVGRSFAVDRVVALSSPCDQTATGPASWLDVSKSTYATSPAAAYYGLGAPGDTVCTGYPAIWTALGMATSRQHADAVVCAGAAAHGATIECVENAPVWTTMLQ